jgi:hypothetical protein
MADTLRHTREPISNRAPPSVIPTPVALANCLGIFELCIKVAKGRWRANHIKQGYYKRIFIDRWRCSPCVRQSRSGPRSRISPYRAGARLAS